MTQVAINVPQDFQFFPALLYKLHTNITLIFIYLGFSHPSLSQNPSPIIINIREQGHDHQIKNISFEIDGLKINWNRIIQSNTDWCILRHLWQRPQLGPICPWGRTLETLHVTLPTPPPFSFDHCWNALTMVVGKKNNEKNQNYC